MTFNEIQTLIKFVSKNNVSEVLIEQKDFKLQIKTDSNKEVRSSVEPTTIIQTGMPVAPMAPFPMPAPAPVASAPAVEESGSADVDSKYVTIKAPMIGTFYRSANPESDPFVGVGDEIKPGKVICIVEAMKLFNEIEAEISGKIVKVLVDDASPIEYDQPLFIIEE